MEGRVGWKNGRKKERMEEWKEGWVVSRRRLLVDAVCWYKLVETQKI